MECAGVIREFTQMCKEVFGEELSGVYLHGSLAMGCFHPAKSDIDLIVLVKSETEEETRAEFIRRTVLLNEKAPEKGIETSVVLERHARCFVHPARYEVHFSNAFLEDCRIDPLGHVRRVRGTDRDLAAHFAVIREFGIALFGSDAKAVFAPVPRKDYLDSIWYDMENAEEEILKNPVYVVLNACRAAAYAEEGRILSKKAGGEWGIRNFPSAYAALIEEALSCYTEGRQMRAEETMKTFAREAKRRFLFRAADEMQI